MFHMNQVWYLVAITLFLLEGFESAEYTDANGDRHVQRKLKGGGYKWVKVAAPRAVLTEPEELKLRLTIQNKAKLVDPDYFEEKVKEALDYEIKNNRVKTKDKGTNVEKVVTLNETEKKNLVDKAVSTLQSMYKSGMLGKRTKPVPKPATVPKPWAHRVSNPTKSSDIKARKPTPYKGSRLSPNPDKNVRKPAQSLPKSALKVPGVQAGPPGGSGTTVSVKNGRGATNVSIQTESYTKQSVQFEGEDKENNGGQQIPGANQRNGIVTQLANDAKSALGALKGKSPLGFQALKDKSGLGASKDKSVLSPSTNGSNAVIDDNKSVIAVPKKKPGFGAQKGTGSHAVKVTVTQGNQSVQIESGMSTGKNRDVSVTVSRQAPNDPGAVHLNVIPEGAENSEEDGADD